MKQDKTTLPRGSAAEQADYWLTLLESPLADERQRRHFQQWLSESAENRTAYAKAQAFWQRMDTLDAGQVERLERRLAADAYVPPKSQPTRSIFPSIPIWQVPAMACLLLFIYIGIEAWPRYAADYRTGIGEQQTIQLSDGSTVMLNTSSYLSVDYSQQRRTLTLHGQAYFSVAPDPDRPFVVVTDNGRVRALGTAFDVKALDDDMAVTVYQHAVRVAFDRGEIIERLEEGERVAFEDGRTSQVELADLKQVRGWREQRLVFVDRPLNRVIAELERYRPGNIVILDSELAKHRVTGAFDPRDTDAALNAIEKTLHIKQYRLSDRLVLLSR